MARTSYFEDTGIRWLAHRGLWQHRDGVSENSLEAFAEALSHGATHIESDVHATKDGHAVLFHDADLRRAAGVNLRIADLTLADLQDIELIGGSRVPTLSEALHQFPEVRFNLDVKASGAVGATADDVNRTASHQRVLISSFSPRRRLATLSALAKPVATGADSVLVARVWASYRSGSLRSFAALCAGIDAIQMPTDRFGIRFDDSGFITELNRMQVEAHFWTINEPAEMQRLLGLGASGIVTDRVDLAPKAV
jgi:glycerophosphoryl diester phosphodiesterase